MDLLTILILSLCVFIPYFTFIAAVGIISYSAKLKSAKRFFERLSKTPPSEQATSKLAGRLKFFVLIVLTLLSLLLCLVAITIGTYFNIPLVSNINRSWLGKIILIGFVSTTIITILSSIFYNYFVKLDD